VAPGLVLAQLVAQNGLAVTFPSWVSVDPRRAGIDATGQGLLVMLAALLALVIAVLPAALVAAIVGGLVYLLLGTVPIILPGLLAGIALLIESFVGTEVIGAILERSDISAVDARET
jgi:ABC-type sulfate transport system permease component